MTWMERPADIKFLLDSGLLYMINKEVLHPVGLALVAKQKQDGTLSLGIKDSRSEPHLLAYNKVDYGKAQDKFRKFMKEFGNGQLDKRRKHLGWGTQSWFATNKNT